MGEFSAEWLALRESADARARSARLVERLGDWLARGPRPVTDPSAPLPVLDLGCGTGANLRYLAPRLAASPTGRQRWTCVDRDPELLAALCRETATWAERRGLEPSVDGDRLEIRGHGVDWQIRTLCSDLARVEDAPPIEQGTLVAASALLDLVSEDWLLGLLRTCAAARAPMLLTLSYDGRVSLEPPHLLDGVVIGLFNAHQLRDKGMGPALGPCAPSRLVRLAALLGLSVQLDASDWHLQPEETRIQNALTDGWAAAALEQTAETDGTLVSRWGVGIGEWREARLAQIAAGRSYMRVGHRDALLLPR
jgi:SAM-dependent methyltransferase